MKLAVLLVFVLVVLAVADADDKNRPSESPSASPSKSPSASASSSQSASRSASSSHSPSASRSPSASASASRSPSASASSSQSASRSASRSQSPSASRSPSASASASRSASRSQSPSASRSPSASASHSASRSASRSQSPSASRSPSASASHSASRSASRSQSPSASRSPSASASHSQSASRSASRSHSPSASRSPSASASHSASRSHSASASRSPSASASHSHSASRSASRSHSPSASRSPSASASHSHSASRSASSSHSPSASASRSHSASRSASSSRAPSRSASASASPSAHRPHKCPKLLDGATGFNVYVLGSSCKKDDFALQMNNVQVDGRIAVDGGLKADQSGLVVKLPYSCDAKDFNVIVDGDLKATNTQQFAGSLAIDKDGKVIQAPFFLQKGAGVVRGNIFKLTGVDLDAINENLMEVEHNLCSIKGQRAQVRDFGAIWFVSKDEDCGESSVDYFEVDAEDLDVANFIKIKASAEAVVILVKGHKEISFGNLAVEANRDASRILWVFGCTGKDTTVSNINLPGSVLTTYGLTITDAQVKGTIVAGTLCATRDNFSPAEFCY